MSLEGVSGTPETATPGNETPGCETRSCADCDKPFTPLRASARYCSPACRLRAHRAKTSSTTDTKPRTGAYKGYTRTAKADKPKRPCLPTPTATAPPRPRGGQTIYDEAIVEELLWRLAHGETLNRIIDSDPAKFPARSTVNDWVQKRPDFSARFARARDLMFEHWADELVDVGDQAIDNPEKANGLRLACDNRKWLLARLKPALYSERFQADLTSDGKPLMVASDLDIAKALARALAAHALPAPTVIDAVATEVTPEGEAS